MFIKGDNMMFGKKIDCKSVYIFYCFMYIYFVFYFMKLKKK